MSDLETLINDIHEEAVSKGFWSNPCNHSNPHLGAELKWCPDCGAVDIGSGWQDPKERQNNRPRPEQYALFISEIMEAFEEYRKPGVPEAYVLPPNSGRMEVDVLGMGAIYPRGANSELLKPEGELVECADLFIRLCDDIGHHWGAKKFLAAVQWKFAYNKTRGFRHGGKKA